IQYPGALYHITARGNAYQNIYLDDKDRRIFLRNLADCLRTHRLICHAYCLMGNHYHLLLETPEGNLSAGMRDINGKYTQLFNARHKSVGHLLQGRYKAFLIEKEPYFLSVARYIVLNPVRSGLVKTSGDYLWCNYNATAGRSRAPEWLMVKWTRDLFSPDPALAKKQYREFVHQDQEQESPFDRIREGTVLGSPQFIGWVWQEFGQCEEEKEIKTSERMVSRPSLEDLFAEAKGKKERDLMIKMARQRGGYSLTEIAKYLGLDRSTVSRIYNQVD
ncbi:transposase, partial [Patescibacteria group bacterium]|nr:transposase [Patescibacteria group bacterium]MBU1705407.1 transposase [Patescibacteria group bacterium]